jgi:hypothetical protein
MALRNTSVKRFFGRAPNAVFRLCQADGAWVWATGGEHVVPPRRPCQEEAAQRLQVMIGYVRDHYLVTLPGVRR